jgi:hypothetical protein
MRPNSRILGFLFAGCLFVCSARATTVTYDFTYNGTGTYDPAETVTGTGSFTASYTPGSTVGTLTAFSFTDTFVSPINGDSTFNYTTATGTINFSRVAPYSLATVALQSNFGLGTNTDFLAVDFTLNDSAGTIFDNTVGFDAGAPANISTASTGGGTITLVSSTVPEPATLGLFGFAAVAIGILRFRASSASA